MTSKKCIRCKRKIIEVAHCDNCYDDRLAEIQRILEENTKLKKVLRGIMEIARVVEE